jgi:hypothetical protein
LINYPENIMLRAAVNPVHPPRVLALYQNHCFPQRQIKGMFRQKIMVFLFGEREEESSCEFKNVSLRSLWVQLYNKSPF